MMWVVDLFDSNVFKKRKLISMNKSIKELIFFDVFCSKYNAAANLVTTVAIQFCKGLHY